MDRLFAAAAAAKTGNPPRRNPPQPVYKVKNPRPFPPGRLEMVIAEQRSNMGRDVLISPWSADGLPVLPVHADIRIYPPQEDFLIGGRPEGKTIGWIDGWIVQTGRIMNEGFDFQVTDEVAAMSLQLFDKYGEFIDPEDRAPGLDERRGDVLYIESVFVSSRYRGYGLGLLAVSHLIDQLPSFQGDLILLSPGPLNPHFLPKPKAKSNAKPKTTTGSKSNAKAKRHNGQAPGTDKDKKPSTSASASASGGQTARSRSSPSHKSAPLPKPKRTKEERLAGRAKACDRISAHWELMGFSRYTTEKQEKSEDGIPIWGLCTAYQNPRIETIVPHLFVRPDRNASLKGKGKSKDEDDNDNDDNDNDDNADEEEEDLGFKGGWASDSDNAESSFDQIDWDKARKKQMANMRKMMRWTPYLRDDDPNDPEESDALSEDIFGLPSPPPPVLEMMDLFREAILNGLWPYNSKPPAPPAPMAPASKTGPSTDKPDNTSKTTSSKTKVTSPSVPKTDTNAATKPKEKVVKQDRSRDRPGLGIDNGAKAGPSKLRA